MTVLTHLHQSVIQFLELPEKIRISRILAPRWVGYPQALTILSKLEELKAYPRSHRMPNLLIAGSTNNGKTMLVKRFCQKYEPDDNIDGEEAIVPVLYVQAPPVPDEGRFYSNILTLLFAPHRHSDRVEKKQFQVLTLLRRVGVQILVIDEIHHILAGNLNKQRIF